MPQRMTKQIASVLESFLSDLTRDWYGFDLIERTALKSGTVYPILHLLEKDGWLSSAREGIDPQEEGRPARRLYTLTGLGEREAKAVLERRASATSRAPRGGAPQLRPGGASI
jgi:DNA-binding PadR family transcriptional regulator